MIRIIDDPSFSLIEYDTFTEQRRILIAFDELSPLSIPWTSDPKDGNPGTIGSSRIPRELLERVVARVEWTRKVIEAADTYRDAFRAWPWGDNVKEASVALERAACPEQTESQRKATIATQCSPNKCRSPTFPPRSAGRWG